MNLPNTVVLEIIDKLLVAIIVLVVGFWLNRRLEALKGGLSLQTALAPKRTAAYETLWEKTEPLTPRDVATLDMAAATSACLEDLRHWYYDKGNAMYLSLPAADLFLRGLRLLEHADRVSSREIKAITVRFGPSSRWICMCIPRGMQKYRSRGQALRREGAAPLRVTAADA